MKLKKWTAIILALTLFFSLSTATLACGHSHCGYRPQTHVCADADWDGWCDGCGASCAHSVRRHGHHGRC